MARCRTPSSYLEPVITHVQAVGTSLPKTLGTETLPAPSHAPATEIPHLVLDASRHEITTTSSRHITSPHDFLNALRWALRLGVHPKATTTTLRVAEALAAKANRQGHLAYGRTALAAHLDLSVDCVAAHSRILRELGLLVWVEHGSKANILRTRNPGIPPTSYKGTATIFAFTVPAAYDSACGRRLNSQGYHARVIAVTDRGRRHETRMARAAYRGHATRPTAGRTTSPSRGSSRLQQEAKAGGKNNYTRKLAHNPSSPVHHHPRTTPAQAKACIAAAQNVRQKVHWLRGTCSRRLAYLLRGRLLAPGADLADLAAELYTAPRGPVRDPLAFLAHYLRLHPTTTGSEPECVGGPTSEYEPAVGAQRPSPISLLTLVSRRFLGDDLATPASLVQLPHLSQAWEERQVALAIARTLEYWRSQDAQGGHPWDRSEEPEAFLSASDCGFASL